LAQRWPWEVNFLFKERGVGVEVSAQQSVAPL
jgi:hypothetical protein